MCTFNSFRMTFKSTFAPSNNAVVGLDTDKEPARPEPERLDRLYFVRTFGL